MKKPYEKPMLYVEDFSLSEHIAIGCKLLDTDGKNSLNPYTCTMDYGGMVLFTNSVCDSTQGHIVYDVDRYPMFCYNGPSPDRIVFGS